MIRGISSNPIHNALTDGEAVKTQASHASKIKTSLAQTPDNSAYTLSLSATATSLLASSCHISGKQPLPPTIQPPVSIKPFPVGGVSVGKIHPLPPTYDEPPVSIDPISVGDANAGLIHPLPPVGDGPPADKGPLPPLVQPPVGIEPLTTGTGKIHPLPPISEEPPAGIEPLPQDNGTRTGRIHPLPPITTQPIAPEAQAEESAVYQAVSLETSPTLFDTLPAALISQLLKA